VPRAFRTHQQPQTAALLGGQLQAPERVPVQLLRPRQHCGHGRASQRLVQGPGVVGLVAGADDDHLLQLDPQPGSRGRIELAGLVEHDDRPSFPTSLPGGAECQGFASGAAAGGEPFHQGAPVEPPFREEPIQRLAATGDRGRLVAASPGPFQSSNLLLQCPDEPAAGWDADRVGHWFSLPAGCCQQVSL